MPAKRDRPDDETGVPPIEVTPEMIEAGVAALRKHYVAEDDIPMSDINDVVRDVLRAAHSAAGDSRRIKQ